MHLRIITLKRGKSVTRYAQIVERYYVNGKAKNRIIKHLGPVKSDNDIEKYRKIFALEKRKESIQKADLRTLDILPPKEYGLIYAARVLSLDSGLFKIFDLLGEYSELIFVSVISRLIDPRSELGLFKVLDKIEYPMQLPVTKDRMYRALDELIMKKDDIEKAIVQVLKPDLKRVYYDLTSTYFEGSENNSLVMFGYSRDKKRGKEQVVIGIVMADGIPIYHEVYPGNRVDPATLESTIEGLKEKYNIKEVVFIEDRAFGRTPSLKLLDGDQYITAVYRWDLPYRDILMNTEIKEEDKVGDMYIKEVSVKVSTDHMSEEEKKRIEKRRYIFVYNPEREILDKIDISEKVDAVDKILKSGKSEKELKTALGKLRSFVKGSELNIKKIEAMKKLSGKYMIVTNTSMPVVEVVKNFKDLWKIERAFRTMKSYIEIRPVYHRKEARIKAHIFVCVLSLLYSRIIEKRMNEKMTIAEIAEKLSELKSIPVKTEEGIITLRSESENARELLKELGIPYPGRIINTLHKAQKK